MNALATLPPESHAAYNEHLGEEITLLAGQINAANYRLLKLIAEFDDRKAWSGGGTVRSCAHWLNWQCGIALGAAREKVRVAHCLDKLPLTDAAFAAGELSFSKVRAMTRVATPENEDFLLIIARHSTASHMEKVVGKYQHVQRTLRDELELEQEAARKLVYYQDDAGMWIVHARLPQETGSLLVKAIAAVATPVQIEKQRQIMARAEELEGEHQPEEAAGNEDKKISAEIFSQAVEQEESMLYQDLLEHTRADALVTIAEHFLATSDQQPQWQGLKGSERCQVMLHVDINTLRQHSGTHSQGPEHCNLDNKYWLSPKTARRLACDASLVTVLEDEQGKVLNIGRRARTVPASVRRALSVRDETCRFPGCVSQTGEAHHIQHWADGGETGLENLITLCKYHHGQLHRGCFDVRRVAAESASVEPRWVFCTPSGGHIEPSVFPQFPPQAVDTAATALQEMAPGVDANTCKPEWYGDSCDYGIAIQSLLRRDGLLCE